MLLVLQPPPGEPTLCFLPHHTSQERPREDFKKKKKKKLLETDYITAARKTIISPSLRKEPVAKQGRAGKPRPLQPRGGRYRVGLDNRQRAPPFHHSVPGTECSRQKLQPSLPRPSPNTRVLVLSDWALLLPFDQGLQEQGLCLPSYGLSLA